MQVSAATTDWTDANQRVLVAEFARLRVILDGADVHDAQAEIERRRVDLRGPAAIDHLEQQFSLSAFERDLLLLAAGIEMDTSLSAAAARRTGVAQAGASFALAAAALPGAHWTALAPVRPLRRWCLIEVEADAPLVTARLRADERVIHLLAGLNYLDPRLRALFRAVPFPGALAPSHATLARRIAEDLCAGGPPTPCIQLVGGDPHGQEDVAASIAEACHLRLHAVRAEDLPGDAHERNLLLARWERDAALLDSALLLEIADGGGAAARRFADACGGLVLVAAREPIALRRPDRRFRVDLPERGEQLGLWRSALGPVAERLNGEVESVSAHFRLTARDIVRTATNVRHAAARTDSVVDLLWESCRDLEHVPIGGLAQRIESVAAWDDLVLPAAQKDLLRQIAVQVRHRMQVHEAWGFGRQSARGLGVTALFTGESGTGKTMAAEVLARELHLDLYRIDLSSVVSKYIGETEKHLARVFDAAERSGAILLFDEADALFGKRSEVRDSHDRYANIEVSYLLQRMEAYRGLAILTTNLKTALDPAFQRRLRFVVEFPFPGTVEREAIWKSAFPPSAPTRDLAPARLAQLQVAGGQIRNIALTAAFLAAEAGEPVSMPHLLSAARADAAKRERTLTESETRGWV